MTTNERIQAVVDFGFTERQARFLVLVMRHAGVCVPRQYARFAGVAHGAKCNAFFDKLVRRGYAVANTCIHNRARLYHVHHKPLYHVIGEVTSRYRRRVPARLAVQRVMLLDAVLTTPDLDWLTTASEKSTYHASLTESKAAQPSREMPAEAEPRPASDLPGTFPIGLEPDGRAVLLYLATEPWTDGFRSFLQGHAALLRAAPTWTLRLVFPRPLDRLYDAYQTVIREELESPLHPADQRQLNLPAVLPRFRMLPDCLIEFVLSFASTDFASDALFRTGLYACRRSAAIPRAPNAGLRMPPSAPTVNEGNVIESAIAVVNGDHALTRRRNADHAKRRPHTMPQERRSPSRAGRGIPRQDPFNGDRDREAAASKSVPASLRPTAEGANAIGPITPALADHGQGRPAVPQTRGAERRDDATP